MHGHTHQHEDDDVGHVGRALELLERLEQPAETHELWHLQHLEQGEQVGLLVAKALALHLPRPNNREDRVAREGADQVDGEPAPEVLATNGGLVDDDGRLLRQIARGRARSRVWGDWKAASRGLPRGRCRRVGRRVRASM